MSNLVARELERGRPVHSGSGWDTSVSKYGYRLCCWDKKGSRIGKRYGSGWENMVGIVHTMPDTDVNVNVSHGSMPSQCGGVMFDATPVKLDDGLPPLRGYTSSPYNGGNSFQDSAETNYGIGLLRGLRTLQSRAVASEEDAYKALDLLEHVFVGTRACPDAYIVTRLPGYPISVASGNPRRRFNDDPFRRDRWVAMRSHGVRSWWQEYEAEGLVTDYPKVRSIGTGQHSFYNSEPDYNLTVATYIKSPASDKITIGQVLWWLRNNRYEPKKVKDQVYLVTCNYLRPSKTTAFVEAVKRLAPEIEKAGWVVRHGMGRNTNHQYHDLSWVLIADKRKELSNA